MCRHKSGQIKDLIASIKLIDLDEIKKKIIIYRVSAVLHEYSDRSSCYSTSFHILRITITVGSLIVPALLSVQGGSMSTIVYWCVWVLSLCVTISNGVMTLFKVDKKYYVLNTTFQHLISEGWQYIELTGRYDGRKTPGMPTTHDTQFILFCSSIEKVRMKQVEDEYVRVPELREGAAAAAASQRSPDTLLPLPLFRDSAPIVNGFGSTQAQSPKVTVRRKDTSPQEAHETPGEPNAQSNANDKS